MSTSHGQRYSGRRAGFVASLALLVALCAALIAPASVLADVSYTASTEASTATASSTLTVPSPGVTQGHVESGAILIAHLVAVGSQSQSTIYLCPTTDGWVELSRTLDTDALLVQQLWYRVVESPQDATTTYTFGVNRNGCGSASTGTPNRSLTGVISLYTGVETTDPILANRSRATGAGDADQGPTTRFRAPQIAEEQPAGSYELRFFSMNEFSGGINDVVAENSVDLPRRYQARSDATDERTIAAFGYALPAATTPATFMVEATSAVTWAASTVILREADEIAPTTTATATTPDGTYSSGDWTNQTVTVNLSAQDDTDGTGVANTYYSLNGADAVTGTQVIVSTEGSTTISYWSVDNAGNVEDPQTFTVNIDQTDPTVSASGATTAAPYTSGSPTRDDVTVTLTAQDTAGASGVREIRYTIGTGQEQVVPGATTTIPVTTEGTTTISYYAVDNAGNAGDPQTFTVVIDRTAPVISGMPQDQTVEPTSPSGAVVTWQSPTATDDVSGPLQVVCTPPSGSTFGFGTTTVTCTATDQAGNTASDSFDVTVLGEGDLFDELRAMIDDLGLARNTERTLLIQTNMAEALADANKPGLACIQLTSIDLQVRAQESRRRISRADAAEIYAQTQQIRDVIGCGRTVR